MVRRVSGCISLAADLRREFPALLPEVALDIVRDYESDDRGTYAADRPWVHSIVLGGLRAASDGVVYTAHRQEALSQGFYGWECVAAAAQSWRLFAY